MINVYELKNTHSPICTLTHYTHITRIKLYKIKHYQILYSKYAHTIRIWKKCWKNCIDELSPILTRLFSISLENAYVPLDFKSAIMQTLIKKPGLDKNVYKNYRLVSNLSFVSKVLEKVVDKRIETHLNTHSLHEPHQSAYKKFHSTETALVRVQKDILQALDNNEHALLVMLDLTSVQTWKSFWKLQCHWRHPYYSWWLRSQTHNICTWIKKILRFCIPGKTFVHECIKWNCILWQYNRRLCILTRQILFQEDHNISSNILLVYLYIYITLRVLKCILCPRQQYHTQNRVRASFIIVAYSCSLEIS